MLSQLDAIVAANQGLIPRSQASQGPAQTIPLAEGRKLYENHIKRPRVAGGVAVSTQKRYRTVFDKFILFAESIGIKTWNAVTSQTINAYATHLDRKNYAGKSLKTELVVLIQVQKWLINEKHLVGAERLKIKIGKVEGQRAFCYTPIQVETMVAHCKSKQTLGWLANVLVVLSCTGLRIAELCSLRWSDIDQLNGRLNLTDESGRAREAGKKRRELKSGRSRQLPIHTELANVLAGLRHVDAYVLHGSRGGRLKPDTVRSILVREVIKPLQARFPSAEDEQGFKDGRLHSFRHYFASLCAHRGVPERVVMDWLGHKDSTMVRHYYHLHDAESRQQMDRLNPLNTAGTRPAGINNRAEETKPTETTTDPGEPVATAT
ncbi:MAG: tyrosine-type recombinase/integrase [Pirellulaceae bacterium]